MGFVLSGLGFSAPEVLGFLSALFPACFSAPSSTTAAVDFGGSAGQAFKAGLISAGFGMVSVEASRSTSSSAFSGVLPRAAALAVTGCPCLGENSSEWGSSSV
jgi:hypothetical protein